MLNLKDDGEFFDLFLEFLERNFSRRELLLVVVKKDLIEKSQKIYS